MRTSDLSFIILCFSISQHPICTCQFFCSQDEKALAPLPEVPQTVEAQAKAAEDKIRADEVDAGEPSLLDAGVLVKKCHTFKLQFK